MTDDLEQRLREASLFPRIVTHDEARQSAKNFIDAHFNNRDGKGALTGIPARAEHDDLVLSDYIRQRRVADEAQADEIARLRAENEALREALAETTHELAACLPLMSAQEGYGDVARAVKKGRTALKGSRHE